VTIQIWEKSLKGFVQGGSLHQWAEDSQEKWEADCVLHHWAPIGHDFNLAS